MWQRSRTGVGVQCHAGPVLVCLLLMLMVMGNVQASLAPLSMTLFYG